MSLSRSRVFPGVCAKAHEGVFQGAPRGGAHTSPPYISLRNSGASNCWTRQMKDAFGDLQNGTVYRSDLLQCRKLNISNLRIDLRFRHQAVWREARGQDPCSCLKKSVAYHNWFALPE